LSLHELDPQGRQPFEVPGGLVGRPGAVGVEPDRHPVPHGIAQGDDPGNVRPDVDDAHLGLDGPVAGVHGGTAGDGQFFGGIAAHEGRHGERGGAVGVQVSVQRHAGGTGGQVQERPVDSGTGSGGGRRVGSVPIVQPGQDRLARLVEGLGSEARQRGGLAPAGVAVGVGEAQQQDLAVADRTVGGRHGTVEPKGALEQAGAGDLREAHVALLSTSSRKDTTASSTAGRFSTWAAWPASAIT
jgi:hypothetical protein